MPEYIKLMRHMEGFGVEHLRFISDFLIPADNNLAERQNETNKSKKENQWAKLKF